MRNLKMHTNETDVHMATAPSDDQGARRPWEDCEKPLSEVGDKGVVDYLDLASDGGIEGHPSGEVIVDSA